MLYNLIIIVVGASVFLIIISFMPFSDQRPNYDYLESLTRSKSRFSNQIRKLNKISLAINKPFSNHPYLKQIQDKLDLLMANFGAVELLLLKEVLAVIFGIIALSNFSFLYALAGILVGFFLPDLILNQRISAMKNSIARVFPETIDLLDLCIGAGLDFTASVSWVSQKSSSNPFIEQLVMVLNEIRIGKSRIIALREMAERLRVPDVSSFTRTIIQAEKMGTSIEEALRNLSEDTRMMRFQRGERFAIKASLKILIPLLFFILPVIMIVVAGPVIINFTQGGLIPAGAGGGM